MKKKQKQRQAYIIIVSTLLIGSYFCLAWFWSMPPFNPSSNIPTSDQSTNQPTKQQTDQLINSNQSNNNTIPDHPPSKTPIQNEGSDVNQLPNLTGYISNKSVNQTQQQLTIRVVINQFLSQNGSCHLTLTKDKHTVSITAPTIDNPSSSTCEGFDVPLSQLSSGKWKLQIVIKSGDKQGIINDEVML